MDGWMDGWTDGRMDSIISCFGGMIFIMKFICEHNVQRTTETMFGAKKVNFRPNVRYKNPLKITN